MWSTTVANHLERRPARLAFVEIIGNYSEEIWAAGWMKGIEDEVRKVGGIFTVLAYLAEGWPRLSDRPAYEEGGEAVPWLDLMDWEPLTEEERLYAIRTFFHVMVSPDA